MPTEIQNPLSLEKLDAHQDQLGIDLHDKCKNERSWQNVIGILMPHFRAQLNQVINAAYARRAAGTEVQNSPLIPSEIDQLCASVDQIFVTHKALLDVEGDFKPVKKAMVGIRKKVRAELLEEFYADCRAVLAEHGVHDRLDLINKGAKWFVEEKFGKYGIGKTFARYILQEIIESMNHDVLHRTADAIGFPAFTIEIFRAALAENGITDRITLHAKGSGWFARTQFGKWGQGKTFASTLLGKTVRTCNHELLDRVADKMQFPKLNKEQLKMVYRKALASHGITSYVALMQWGVKAFQEAQFEPWGQGLAFASAIFGRNILYMTKDILEEVADAVGFKEPSAAEVRSMHIGMLAGHEINNRAELMACGSEKFMTLDFPPYGHGFGFVTNVLGRSAQTITRKTLAKVADKLGW